MASTSELLEEKVNTPRAAAMLGVSTETIRRWVNSGDLEGYKVGQQYRIPIRSLREALGRSAIIGEESK